MVDKEMERSNKKGADRKYLVKTTISLKFV